MSPETYLDFKFYKSLTLDNFSENLVFLQFSAYGTSFQYQNL